MMPENRIIPFVPIRDQVAGIVRIMILKGELSSDQLISERYFSQMLNISTTPVKEAFRVLQSEGLIYSVPRKGSYVSPMSKANMAEVTFIRSALEGVAAYYAALKATRQEIAEMDALLKRIGQLIELGHAEDRQQISADSIQFHQILRNASRNTYLVGMLANMRSIDTSLRTVNLNLAHVDPGADHAEHKDILEAIRSRDAVRAEQSMNAHIRRVVAFVLEEEADMEPIGEGVHT